MKNKVKYLWLALSVVALSACGQKANSDSEKEVVENEKVVVASVGSDAEIWKFIASSSAAKEAGLEIEVKEITGGPITNQATADGDVDANAFQSIGYLESFNADNVIQLAPIAATYVEPMGIYSDKFASIEEISEGVTVALADNPSNTTRGLRLLETAGLIQLKADFDDGVGTPDDVIENPKKLQFTLIDDLTGPRILPDVDLVLIGNTIALEGGLNVLQDSIFHEEADTALRATVNVLAVKADRASEEKLIKLGALYHDPEVQAFVNEKFDGTKVEVNTDIADIWGN
ncbi:MetQ/NlpA family ABC transporter substrate-binding protein [Enterococcus lemanii]|uniref:MetQ/NlpA family ABC transporter substrate-binding protein n=1 Tax=Enterococcus lemanii TaxID=1159752 RepID=A0ABV9MZI2_9ENTE|nr:MetQ/NlpA family ABC transporter substrate-binding protein [Enterococcus lemanii]MBM7710223.1 D-methionine transport system substrate-binding protein [Enterococcus lemanii]